MKQITLGLLLFSALGSGAFANPSAPCTKECAAHCESIKVNCKEGSSACSLEETADVSVQEVKSERRVGSDRF